MKDGANTACIWSPQRNCYRYNDTLQKHQSNCSLTWWRTNFFNIVTGVLQGNTLAPYLCLDNVLWISIDLIKENDFIMTKIRRRWYPAETIREADYTDDLLLLTNASAQAESLLHYLEQSEVLASMWIQWKQSSYVLNKKWHPTPKSSGTVHIPWLQHLINWKWCEHIPCKGVECHL